MEISLVNIGIFIFCDGNSRMIGSLGREKAKGLRIFISCCIWYIIELSQVITVNRLNLCLMDQKERPYWSGSYFNLKTHSLTNWLVFSGIIISTHLLYPNVLKKWLYIYISNWKHFIIFLPVLIVYAPLTPVLLMGTGITDIRLNTIVQMTWEASEKTNCKFQPTTNLKSLQIKWCRKLVSELS